MSIELIIEKNAFKNKIMDSILKYFIKKKFIIFGPVVREFILKDKSERKIPKTIDLFSHNYNLNLIREINADLSFTFNILTDDRCSNHLTNVELIYKYIRNENLEFKLKLHH